MEWNRMERNEMTWWDDEMMTWWHDGMMAWRDVTWRDGTGRDGTGRDGTGGNVTWLDVKWMKWMKWMIWTNEWMVQRMVFASQCIQMSPHHCPVSSEMGREKWAVECSWSVKWAAPKLFFSLCSHSTQVRGVPRRYTGLLLYFNVFDAHQLGIHCSSLGLRQQTVGYNSLGVTLRGVLALCAVPNSIATWWHQSLQESTMGC